MLKTDIVDTIDEFRSLKKEWTELLTDSPSNVLFLSWEWMYTWWTYLAEDRRLYIVTIRSEGTLIGIAPLALCSPNYRRLMPFAYLEFIASGNVGSDFLGFIVRNGHQGPAEAAICEALLSQPHMVELVRVEKNSGSLTTISKIARLGRGTTNIVDTNICPFIDIAGLQWDNYVSMLGKRHKKNLLRRLRKLENEFDLSFTSTKAGEVSPISIQEFIELHNTHWDKIGESTAFNTNALFQFHVAFATICQDNDWLRLCRLQLNGETAAAVYLFTYNDHYYFYQTALNDAYRKYSAGMVALALSIKLAIDEGAKTFEMLHDNETYKYLWTTTDKSLVRMEIYPSSFNGALSRRMAATKTVIRDISSKLRKRA